VGSKLRTAYTRNHGLVREMRESPGLEDKGLGGRGAFENAIRREDPPVRLNEEGDR